MKKTVRLFFTTFVDVEEDTNPIDESVSINRYDVTEKKEIRQRRMDSFKEGSRTRMKTLPPAPA